MTEQPAAQLGYVYLVGAGPGDPGLITMRGVHVIRRADLILYDYLVNPALLGHATPQAEAICLGGHATGRTMAQGEVNARMVQASREGKTVVRLKGGSPDVFAHLAEETEALASAGVPYEVVPGITAALAAAGYAGIPITHGDHSSAVALVTGQERQEKAGPRLDYEALGSFPGTLIVYMGVTTARRWSEALIRGGRSPQTPVAILRRCSLPDQQMFRCDLQSVASEIDQRRVRPPAVIVVGEVAALAPEVSWFTARPLFGRRVLVTRPRDQVGTLWDRFSELGAEVLVQPAIEIGDPPDWAPVDRELMRLDAYDWLVFSSSNGVRFLFERLLAGGGDLRRLGGLKLAAIGPGTAEELAQYRLRADLIPEQYRAESLAAALAAEAPSKRMLLVRASRGREVLAERLSAAGSAVRQIVVYSSTDVQRPDPAVAKDLAAGRIDWITISSSAIARSLWAMFGEDLRRSRLASISPITSETLRKLGCEPAVEAKVYTMAGLVEAILES